MTDKSVKKEYSEATKEKVHIEQRRRHEEEEWRRVYTNRSCCKVYTDVAMSMHQCLWINCTVYPFACTTRSCPLDLVIMFEAEITSEGSGRVVCQRCRNSYEPGTQLHYISNINRAQPGRHLCQECHAYYLQKGTTQRRPDIMPPPNPPLFARDAVTLPQHDENTSQIRHQIAAAQCGETQPVVSVGSGSSTSGPMITPVRPAPPLSLAQNPGPTHKAAILYPNLNISVPMRTSVISFPKLRPPPINPGYQEAHQYWDEMRKHFAGKAYSTNANTEVIIVKVRMMTHSPNKKNPASVSTVYEAISHVPVHIGVSDLKFMAYHALLPQYLEWSKNSPLTMDECQLRDKNWVELIPRQPDVDAIADKFFVSKGKTKAKTFSAKSGAELYLCIRYEKYDAILDHLVQLDEQCHTQSHGFDITTSKAVTKGKKRALSEPKPNENEMKMPRISITLRPDEVQRALRYQQPLRCGTARKLFDTKVVHVQFFRAPAVSIVELIENPERFRKPQSFPAIPLSFSFRPSNPIAYGNFKSAYDGYATIQLFGSDKICVKQCYYTPPGSNARKVYDGAKQIQELTMELNCIGWAAALMSCVYEFVDDSDSQMVGSERRSFELPRMRFVQCGLAVSNPEEPSSSRRSAYLLEEFIETCADGDWFVKYLNNDSAKLRPFNDPEKMIRAQFLSFAQHVQFWKTNGAAFVSDFQGGRTLLTDPQIITDPELGVIFGDGNTNFDTFIHDHDCNRFCQFYKLPSLKELARPRMETPPHQRPAEIESLPPSEEEDLPETPLPLQNTYTSSMRSTDI